MDVPAQMESMKKEADQFAYRCKKMPSQLREWPAYHELKKEIENFQHILPLLMELSKKSIQPRHWQQVNDVTGKELQVEREDFKLQSLIDARLNDFKDEILDITESADKQQIIEEKLADTTALWHTTSFEFSTWKNREVPCVLVGHKLTEVQESLEESQMILNAMNAQRQSAPFKAHLTVFCSFALNVMSSRERLNPSQLQIHTTYLLPQNSTNTVACLDRSQQSSTQSIERLQFPSLCLSPSLSLSLSLFPLDQYAVF